MNNATATFYLYRFEAKVFKGTSLFKDLPMAKLQALAAKIWREQRGKRKYVPTIVAGKGTPHNGELFSYCEGYSRIVLARNQRNISNLLHELTHALGPATHGKNFVKTYFKLIEKYTDFPKAKLYTLAKQYKVL